MALDGSEDVGGNPWLLQEFPDADGAGSRCVGELPRDDDDGRLVQLFVRPHAVPNLPAVHIGHPEIEQHHARTEAILECRERLTAGSGRHDTATMKPEQTRDRLQNLRGVVDDEDVMMAMAQCTGPHKSRIAIRGRARLRANLRA
jgi:hypothetical protein